MATALKRSVISTVRIEGEYQHVSLLPLVFVVGDDRWKHSCPATTPEQDVQPSYSMLAEPNTFRTLKRKLGHFRIDEDIRTMVQITEERESIDKDNNFTDEEKLMNQVNQLDSMETLFQNHQICENFAVVEDTFNFLVQERLPFIEMDGEQMASWIDVKELLFPKCSEPNCCEVLNCLMKKFLYPSNLKLVHPCSEKEQKLFLRKFKLVFQGCMLVNLSEVKKRLDILQAEVEINHLEKSGKKACSYLQSTCSKCSPQRPKTSRPRRRSSRDIRPKSADITSTNENHLSSHDRLAVVPILLVPEKIREPKHYGKSSLGPESDKDDVQFPVLLHYGQEKITVPCSIIARVFPQSYNVLLHCLLTTTNSQLEQHVFSACSQHQAFSFNRWINKFLKDSNVHGITTGSLLINLQTFSEITYDLLPLSTRRLLQSRCRWPDLTDGGFKNVIILENRASPELNDYCDSTCNGNANDLSLVSGSKHNAETVIPQKDVEAEADQSEVSKGKIKTENTIKEMQCVKTKVYDPGDNKPCLPVTRRKRLFRVRTTHKVHPGAVHSPEKNSTLSVSASQISSKKTLRVKSGRKISKSGLSKSPYLSQPAIVKNSAYFSKERLQMSRSKNVRPRSRASENIARKLETWPKAFIATPPSVLRVKNQTKGTTAPNPSTEFRSFPSEESVLHCAQTNTTVDKTLINDIGRNKSKPGRRNCKSNDPIILNNELTLMGDIDPTETVIPVVDVIKLQPGPPKTNRVQQIQSTFLLEDLSVTNNKSVSISTTNVEQSKSKTAEESWESSEVVLTVDEESLDSLDVHLNTYQPVPSWQQLDLQLDPNHANEDSQKAYERPPSSIPRVGISTTNEADGTVSKSSSSVYTTSGSNSVPCSVGKDKMYPLTDTSSTTLSPTNSSSVVSSDDNKTLVPETSPQIKSIPESVPCSVGKDKMYPLTDTSSTTLSPTNSSSVVSSDDNKTLVPETSPQIKSIPESETLKIDGLIEALTTLQVSAPQSKIEDILGGQNDAENSVEEEKTVIDLASDVMKLSVLQNQPVSIPIRPISTSLEIIQTHQNNCNVAPMNASSNAHCRCVPSVANSSVPFETNSTNKQYIQIVNNPSKVKVSDSSQPTYTRKSVSKTLYKGSALKLSNESANTQTLQNALKNTKLVDNSRSILTPEILNISRFQSVGNVMVTNSTKDNGAPVKSAKLYPNRKDDKGCETKVTDAKISQEKRLQHIKINSSIKLHPPNNDQIDSPNTESTSCTVQVPTTSLANIADDEDKPVPGLDLKTSTEPVSQSSVRIKYDVIPSKSFGTGHFLHSKRSARIKKGTNVGYTNPIANKKLQSTRKTDPQEFQEIVTNKSTFRQSSLQDYLSTIPSENDYHIPPSSPIVTHRSQDSTRMNHRVKCCPECKKEQNPNPKYTNMISQSSNYSKESSAASKIKKIIRRRYFDGRYSVISVHDSVARKMAGNEISRLKNSKSKRKQASMSLEINSRLEDNLSVISLCSSREQSIYESKHTPSYSKQSNTPRKTELQNQHEPYLTDEELQVAMEQAIPNTSSKKFNVFFQYGLQHSNDGFTATKTRLDNPDIPINPYDKRFKHKTRNVRQKLRICIDLVGSSEEDSPLKIKKV